MNTRSEALSMDGETVPSVGGGVDFRVNPEWQVVADVSDCKLLGLDGGWSGDTLSYMAGPRWTPYAQVLLGGRKSRPSATA